VPPTRPARATSSQRETRQVYIDLFNGTRLVYNDLFNSTRQVNNNFGTRLVYNDFGTRLVYNDFGTRLVYNDLFNGTMQVYVSIFVRSDSHQYGLTVDHMSIKEFGND